MLRKAGKREFPSLSFHQVTSEGIPWSKAQEKNVSLHSLSQQNKLLNKLQTHLLCLKFCFQVKDPVMLFHSTSISSSFPVHRIQRESKGGYNRFPHIKDHLLLVCIGTNRRRVDVDENKSISLYIMWMIAVTTSSDGQRKKNERPRIMSIAKGKGTEIPKG